MQAYPRRRRHSDTAAADSLGRANGDLPAWHRQIEEGARQRGLLSARIDGDTFVVSDGGGWRGEHATRWTSPSAGPYVPDITLAERSFPSSQVAAMDLRTFACFEADLSDDGEFTAGGDIVRPGGRNVAFTLTDALREGGLAVTSPEQHSFYGWAFSVARGDANIWLLLQFPGPWLLLSQDKTGLLSRRTSDSAALHRRVLETLNQSLVRDARFRNLSWYTKSEYEKGHSRGPGSPAP